MDNSHGMHWAQSELTVHDGQARTEFRLMALHPNSNFERNPKMGVYRNGILSGLMKANPQIKAFEPKGTGNQSSKPRGPKSPTLGHLTRSRLRGFLIPTFARLSRKGNVIVEFSLSRNESLFSLECEVGNSLSEFSAWLHVPELAKCERCIKEKMLHWISCLDPLPNKS